MEQEQLKLALSQWSLHRAIFGNSKENYQQWQAALAKYPDSVLRGTLDPINFPKLAKDQFGFEAVEYVNTFFYRKNESYFYELKKRSDDAAVKNLLIMVDEEGMLGDPDQKARLTAVEAHKKWLEAAAIMGCHSIRVNAHSKGGKEEQKKFAADGLNRICELANSYGLNILIENHGGMSSEPNWLIETIISTGSSNIGTMVDFDNFNYSENKIWDGEQTFDCYKGVEILMPYAKSVSAKSYTFDAAGNEPTIDFERMLNIMKKSNYTGFVSVEFEGESISESDGIIATKALLEKLI
ncbi:MAG: TIM barrel protein [Pedobacter sp.]|nr:TIM barrel protein [Pedobacter sp.]